MNNLLSYCGLVDARIDASDKDLPAQKLWKFSINVQMMVEKLRPLNTCEVLVNCTIVCKTDVNWILTGSLGKKPLCSMHLLNVLSIKIQTTHNPSLWLYEYFWIILLYGHLIYFISKVLAWEICNMKWRFAKKVIIKSQRQFMYDSNFYGSHVT